MTSRKGREIRSALRSKGFEETESDHHRLLHVYKGRRTGIHTKVSHGKTEYGDNLLAQVAKQLRIKKKEALNLIDCPLDEEGYADLLIEAGHLSRDEEDGNA